jgi:hypothetical protein
MLSEVSSHRPLGVQLLLGTRQALAIAPNLIYHIGLHLTMFVCEGEGRGGCSGFTVSSIVAPLLLLLATRLAHAVTAVP